MAGQGPLNTLATLKDYVPALKPKFVLWFFYEGNDVSDLLYERQSPLLIRYLVVISARPCLAARPK